MEPAGYQKGTQSSQYGAKGIKSEPKGDQQKKQNDIQKNLVPGHPT